ncbi:MULTISPECIES: SMI1/KNR4 family protein [unclassified Nocardia]|uniref:SMI1/KNR4 family protein n=1 Tax=unclassified Nocardia TaxID=2637762 RepID=UPI001CE43795|nr:MULTISPECIES: SMI1/KNR4 family protein [unclassified Nocardia]
MIAIQPKGAVGESVVADAEAMLDTTLPEPYRAWLTANGGGYTSTLEMPAPGGEGVLEEFLSPTELARNYGRGFAVSVPKEYVVIGDGAGGGVAIRLTEPGRGRIYWADYDKAIQLYDDGLIEETDPTEQIMEEIAAGWNEFLASR